MTLELKTQETDIKVTFYVIKSMESKRVLLLCFSNKEDWEKDLADIKEIYRPEKGIFVLQNRFDENEIYITFNTKTEYNFRRKGVIKINRAKGTGTLFTIDALNKLAIDELGYIDKEWIPNWNEFENCLLLIRGEGLEVIPTDIKVKI